MKILSPTGIVGYGFPEESFMAGVALKPDLIACDAGSTDPGPYYLGAGTPFTNATAVKRDMTLMLLTGESWHLTEMIIFRGLASREKDVWILRRVSLFLSRMTACFA